MKLRNIFILLIIIVILIENLKIFTKTTEEIIIKENETIKNDNENLYINPFLINSEPNYNIIKKYNDSRINIITNLPHGTNKYLYDNPVNSTNNNTNKNNLLHFINFLI